MTRIVRDLVSSVKAFVDRHESGKYDRNVSMHLEWVYRDLSQLLAEDNN